jgi:hypothetical protein
MYRIAIAAAALCSLAGCDLLPLDLPTLTLAVKPTTYHTVSYFDAHPVERDQTNAWCGNNPGLAVNIPTCDNADQAGINAFNRKMGWLK